LDIYRVLQMLEREPPTGKDGEEKVSIFYKQFFFSFIFCFVFNFPFLFIFEKKKKKKKKN